MAHVAINGCCLTPLNIIGDERGSVMHFIKHQEGVSNQFAEVYFSTVNENCIKAWKRHTKMISNLVVAHGEVDFVLYDGRKTSDTQGKVQTITLSPDNYMRLTICSGIWVGFKGIKSTNIIANCADMIHDPNEVDILPMDSNEIPYIWRTRC